jgi:hypothetical protein
VGIDSTHIGKHEHDNTSHSPVARASLLLRDVLVEGVHHLASPVRDGRPRADEDLLLRAPWQFVQ